MFAEMLTAKIKSVTGSAVAGFIVLLAVSSCEISGGNGPNGTFGFPYADFEVDGIVVDDLGQPLAGVRVYYTD